MSGRRRVAALLAALPVAALAVLAPAPAALAVPAPGAVSIAITGATASGNRIDLVVTATGLRGGAALDPAGVQVTVGGVPVPVTAGRAGTTPAHKGVWLVYRS